MKIPDQSLIAHQRAHGDLRYSRVRDHRQIVIEVDGGLIQNGIARDQGGLGFQLVPDIAMAGRLIRGAIGQQDILERALRNIIENALIYTPEGSAVEVVVGPGPQIVVTDDGPGIAPAIREKVFERFWRAHTGDGRGSGLGLAIAREILTAHRGRIEISEGVSGGARVSLVFESA